jgi:transcription termination factor Rho
VTKSELESKHLAELHALAAEAGVERYRMLSRSELVEKLAGGSDSGSEGEGRGPEPRQRGRDGASRRPREEKPREGRRPREEQREPREQRESRERRPPRRRGRQGEREPKSDSPPKPEPQIAPATTPAATTPPPARPKRKRRRRWGRRRKGLHLHDLLAPGTPGRQAIVQAESREGCTALLRGLAAELADAADGADPIALLIDPSPEELAEWRREAPQAEIVAASQARHAEDAVAQATLRAGGGENVVVLIDSLSRFAEGFGDPEGARRLFDAGRGGGGEGKGSLSVVAAVEPTAA